jgi:hypothetical protein
MAVTPDITEELRKMVREVLREAVPQRGGTAGSAVETVQIGNDRDLATFLARVTEPVTAERIRSGKLRFTLGGAAPPSVAPAAPLTGVITEQKLDRLAKGGALVLAPDAVLTPLARDRARRLGLKIERRR